MQKGNVMNDLISIIIPVYNGEKYLHRCLDSVISQSYQELEIIIVNDGSTDSSLEICEEYQKRDRRIKIITKVNGGQSSARNAGLEMVSGNYIAYVDCDDWIQTDMFEYLLNLMNIYQTDIAVCDYIQVKRKKRIPQLSEKIDVKEGKELFELFYRINGGKSFFSVWNCLYRRNLVKDIRFWENEINEDIYYTYLVYKKANKAVFSNQIKYNYYINTSGITRSKLSQKDYSQFRIWDKIVACEEESEYYPFALLNRKRVVFNLYMKGKLSGRDDVSMETMKQWKKELRKNYDCLMHANIFDWKRKIVLFLICKLKLV